MPSLFDDIKTDLKAESAVTDLVGSGTASRIFPDRLKAKSALPAIVIERFPADAPAYLTGSVGVASTRVQVDCYAETETAADALAAIIDGLWVPENSDSRTTFDSRVIHCIESQGDTRSGVDPAIPGDTQLRYWASRDYMITHDK